MTARLSSSLWASLSALWCGLPTLWRGLRSATGDDAYERYLEHWHAEHLDADDSHDGEEPAEPMDRKTFHKRRLDEDWKDVRRCC
ncbi:MAG: YbdD/YjiX family protein [Alphaproteobacteria bacterium]|nr:YbdD/YjiX family protein [Alphaproteobacteria bacterium]